MPRTNGRNSDSELPDCNPLTETEIRFGCTVYKVQTLVDGGLRLTLDLPETAIAQAAQLIVWRNSALVAIISTDQPKVETADSKPSAADKNLSAILNGLPNSGKGKKK